MNWLLVGKICTVLIAVLQAIISFSQGSFSLADISVIVSALVSAGFLHVGTTSVKRQMAARGIKLLSIAVLCVLLSGCAAAVAGAGLGASAVGGLAYWLLQQPWTVNICYWIGDEAALKIMPAAPTSVDVDVIAVCGESIAYIQKAQGVPANVMLNTV